MAAHQGKELAYTLVRSLIIDNEAIYKDIPLDKLKEYLMYNIRPFNEARIDNTSDVPMFTLMSGNHHEYDYVLWDDKSNRIMYASEKEYKLIDVLKTYGNIIRIEISPKGVINSFAMPLIHTDTACFHKEYLSGSIAAVEDYYPEKEEITVTVYNPDIYKTAVEDVECEGVQITSYQRGFVSGVVQENAAPCISVTISQVYDDGKKYFKIITDDNYGKKAKRVPCTEGVTLYSAYYNHMVELNCFFKEPVKQNIKKEK